MTNPTTFENAPTSPNLFIPEEIYYLTVHKEHPLVGRKVISRRFYGFEFEVRALYPGRTKWNDCFCSFQKLYIYDAQRLCIDTIDLEAVLRLDFNR